MIKNILFPILIICNLSFACKLFWQNDSTFILQDTSAVFNDTTTVDNDSTIAVDDSATAVRDTLKPLFYKGFDDASRTGYKLTRSSIERSDYRFTGDLINQLPFGFLRDLGHAGQPGEPFVYGLGNGNISYLQDGIPINNRYQSTFDLNLFQSEAIDSIEVISLTRSFFYNNSNQPASINFITRDEIDIQPYTRIRFYQGPENEGMFDGLFSAYFASRLNASFRITNQSVDSRYTNSELSNWNFSSRVRYMPLNLVNFVASYNYSKLNVDLNGGVDFQEIQNNSSPEEYNDILYSNIQAPVLFDERYRKTTRHNLSLKTLFDLSGNVYADASIYYQYYLDEYRQNENNIDTTIAAIRNNNSYKTFGAKLHTMIDYYFMNFEFLGGYESTNYDIDINKKISRLDVLYAGGKVELGFLNKRLMPSLYTKYSRKDYGSTGSYGLDISIKVNNMFSLYAGYSKVEMNNYNFLNDAWITSEYSPLQAGVKFHNSRLNGSISFINLNYNNYLFAVAGAEFDSSKQSKAIEYFYDDVEYSGLNLNLSLHLWKVLLRTNSTYYFNRSSTINNNVPAVTSFGGIYYVDSLFNDNLDLKAGFNYKLYGERAYLNYDYQMLEPLYYNAAAGGYERINPSLIDPSIQVDLFVSGRIRKRATVFFVFENLFDEQYYIVPYYPMHARGLRLGLTWEFID